MVGSPGIPPTRYAATPGGYVAYQVFGEGPTDVLFVANWSTNLDVMWDEPSLADYLGRLGSFGRVVCFDKRGTGVSDPIPLISPPTLEEWMDDAVAALDAAGVREVAVIGDTEGGPMAILLAATYPQRVTALVLVNSFARWQRADDHLVGMPADTTAKLVARWEQNWGFTAEILGLTAPSLADDERARSGIPFVELGDHELRGAPGTWSLFAVRREARHQVATVPSPSWSVMATSTE